MGNGDTGIVHIPPDGGEGLWVTDELIRLVVSSRETGGAYALTDSMVPPGGGVPPHVHHREDEAF